MQDQTPSADSLAPALQAVADAMNNLAVSLSSAGLSAPAGAVESTAASTDGGLGEGMDGGLGDGLANAESVGDVVSYLDTLKDKAIEMAPAVLGALAILVIGWLVSKLVT
ncbi:MAG: hypothetical protein P1V81_14045, partial [Planctomycetota bacterium]|nr:hypothetical protein [Planctomycetota bacterium]